MVRFFLASILLYFLSQSISFGHFSFSLRKKGMIIHNILCIFLLILFISIFVKSKNVVLLIASTIMYILSLVMYYIHEFRGTNVNFSDILSLNTAKEVAGGYTYKIKPIFVICLILLLYQYSLVLKKAPNVFNFKIQYRFFHFEILTLLISRIINLIIFIAVYFILREKISSDKYDYSLFAGENEGYIYNFFSSIPIFHKNEYKSDEIIKEADKFIENAKEVSKYNVNIVDTDAPQNINKIDDIDNKPYIIVIMNESFGTAHERINTNEPVTPYYDSLKCAIKGNLYVNTFGGGTANTEFEFLTGMSIGNYEYPVMPYNNFVKRDKYSLARYFKNIGYKTIAMHPYTATNYHRDKVYKRFGFDKLLFFDDFKNKNYVRKFISDESFYKEVIDVFNKSKTNNEKSFIFGITMQNHSGYKHFEGEEIKSKIDELDDTESIDSYLSLMKISDNALKTLINYFKNEKEHVIILFFGDHNASFGNAANKLIYDNDIVYECKNAYKTPFFIYDNANEVIDTLYIDEISANFLSVELLKKAKLPFDMLHNMLNEIYEKYPVYNYHMRKNKNDKILSDIKMDKYSKLEREYLK